MEQSYYLLYLYLNTMESKTGTRELNRSKTASVSSHSALTCLVAPFHQPLGRSGGTNNDCSWDYRKAAPGSSPIRTWRQKLT